MKTLISAAVAVLLAVNLYVTLHAQTPNNPFQLLVNTATHTSCATTTSTTTFCFAADGLWWSNQGAAFVQVGQSAGVVLTFNGRKPDASGNIAPASGDYAYGQITSTPTKMTLTAAPVTLQ